MRKILRFLAVLAPAVLTLLALAAPTAYASNPHFVHAESMTPPPLLTVSFKEAGLGNQQSVHITVEAEAHCVPVGSYEDAGEEVYFTLEGDFPVRDGAATGSLSGTAPCPPGTVVVYEGDDCYYRLTDTTNGISELVGCFILR